MFIITDGLSNINSEATIPEAEYAKEQGIHIVSVGVNIANDWELRGMASEPADANVFKVNTYQELSEISDKLIDLSCRGWFESVLKFHAS